MLSLLTYGKRSPTDEIIFNWKAHIENRKAGC